MRALLHWHLGALMLAVALALPVNAAEITGVNVGSVTDTTATITWKTDVNTDATINFGLDSRVGVVRDPLFNKKEHTLTIDDLDPSTTYFFRVISTDIDGNKSATGGYAFTTKSGAKPKPPKEIKEVDPEELKKLEELLKQQQSLDIVPPSIVGPPKVIPDTTTAEVTWTTDRETTSLVYFATDAEYAPSKTNPYPSAQGDGKTMTTKHKVTLKGLEPSTEYHFIVSSEDTVGLLGESLDETFRTKSKLPEIRNIKVSKVQETAATVTWQTDVKSKGIVEYTNQRTKVTKLAGNPTFLTNHSLLMNDLEFGQRYTAVIKVTNEGGDEAVSKSFSFITVRDVVPPTIEKVTNESTLYPGEEVKIQTIMTWQTDEPATCQVFYSQGLARQEGDEGESMPPELDPSTEHTQVIVGFASATVYQFWVKCSDPSKNDTRSEDYVLITPVKEKSIIDIILENFQGTFGWVNNIGK